MWIIPGRLRHPLCYSHAPEFSGYPLVVYLSFTLPSFCMFPSPNPLTRAILRAQRCLATGALLLLRRPAMTAYARLHLRLRHSSHAHRTYPPASPWPLRIRRPTQAPHIVLPSPDCPTTPKCASPNATRRVARPVPRCSAWAHGEWNTPPVPRSGRRRALPVE